MPAAVSFLASFLAWCLVRMNRMRRPEPEARVCTRSFLSAALRTSKTWWVIFSTGLLTSSSEWVTGRFRNRLTSLSTPLSRVAEKSMR